MSQIVSSNGEFENGHVAYIATPNDWGYPYVGVRFPDNRVEKYPGKHEFTLGQGVYVLRRVFRVLGVPVWSSRPVVLPSYNPSGTAGHRAYG